MLQTKIRSLPVVDKGEVLGIMFMKEVADATFHGGGKGGGKKGYMANVVGRKGLPAGTRVRPSAAALAAAKKTDPSPIDKESAEASNDESIALSPAGDTCPYSSTSRFDRLTVEMAAYSLPHPFKTNEGVGATQRYVAACESQPTNCTNVGITVRWISLQIKALMRVTCSLARLAFIYN